MQLVSDICEAAFVQYWLLPVIAILGMLFFMFKERLSRHEHEMNMRVVNESDNQRTHAARRNRNVVTEVRAIIQTMT